MVVSVLLVRSEGAMHAQMPRARRMVAPSALPAPSMHGARRSAARGGVSNSKGHRAARELVCDLRIGAGAGSRGRVVAGASKGFGQAGSQKVKQAPEGFEELGSLSMFVGGKATKACQAGRKSLMLFKVANADGGTDVFCTDANSTAFKFPLSDATIVEGEGGVPWIEVPLDGTQYRLDTGEVIKWCPGGGIIRNVLSSLKEKEAPVPLTVYPVKIGPDGEIYVKLSKS